MSAAAQATKRIALPPVPDGWYRAIFSDEIAVGEVKPLSILGQELVAWRGEDGSVRVADREERTRHLHRPAPSTGTWH